MLLQTWTWISLKFPSRFLTKSLFHPLQEWRVYHSLFPWSLILHFSQATQQIWNHNTTSTLREYVFHFNIFLDPLASLEEPFVTHSVMVSQTSSLSDPTADLTFRSNIYQMSQTFFTCLGHLWLLTTHGHWWKSWLQTHAHSACQPFRCFLHLLHSVPQWDFWPVDKFWPTSDLGFGISKLCQPSPPFTQFSSWRQTRAQQSPPWILIKLSPPQSSSRFITNVEREKCRLSLWLNW